MSFLFASFSVFVMSSSLLVVADSFSLAVNRLNSYKISSAAYDDVFSYSINGANFLVHSDLISFVISSRAFKIAVGSLPPPSP